ncbi:AraC family transcriptional regulator [Streptomyces sp. NPDC046985]|uniref:AraC family transcriptional regulator n=1 Tax=Streptomyces sp. NPDC046985 TaxID=3155377 RepID=UPI0033E35FD4
MSDGNHAISSIELAVERAAAAMRENFRDALSLGDMAECAMYSKYHFSREFRRVTGVSPARFLSALRIQEAKKLLLTTDMTVTAVSHTVGYSSVGTFSARFASSVGIPPTEYRRRQGFVESVDPADYAPIGGTVSGTVIAPPDADLGLVFLGLFPSRVPEGQPVRCTVLRKPGPFEIGNVPMGLWYLLGHSVPTAAREALTDDQAVHVGNFGPIDIRSGATAVRVDFPLRGMRILDPPVLLALQRVRSDAFEGGLVPEAN